MDDLQFLQHKPCSGGVSILKTTVKKVYNCFESDCQMTTCALTLMSLYSSQWRSIPIQTIWGEIVCLDYIYSTESRLLHLISLKVKF